MLLTITAMHDQASDLGYLLHKHPDRVQRFPLSFGDAYVYYPEVSDSLCTAALQLDIDPVSLVRAFRGTGQARLLEHYVNDRPYVASSFLSVAIGNVFRSAMAGNSKERQALADTPLSVVATLAVVPCRGGEPLLRRLFEPLDYKVESTRLALDAAIPQWGDSAYFKVSLSGTKRIRDLLRHLYVLIPVLDREKHYWVGEDEIEKLLRHGEEWLSGHPERELIADRYLKHRRSLARIALARLAQGEEIEADDETEGGSSGEEQLEAPLSLNEHRLQAVVSVLKEHDVSRVVDLGCGEGKLLKQLLREKSFKQILGMDVAARNLEFAKGRLKLERLPEKQRQRIQLIHGSLTYRDKRIAGFDAATVIEVIEHIDIDRLDAFERVVFQYAKPGLVIVTTPNAEYNVKFEGMSPGQLRHGDHRFEWTREEFKNWADKVAGQFGYTVTLEPVGDEDPEHGAPTQMAVFVEA